MYAADQRVRGTLRRRVFRDAEELIMAIAHHHTQDPKPFIWTANSANLQSAINFGLIAFQLIVRPAKLLFRGFWAV